MHALDAVKSEVISPSFVKRHVASSTFVAVSRVVKAKSTLTCNGTRREPEFELKGSCSQLD